MVGKGYDSLADVYDKNIARNIKNYKKIIEKSAFLLSKNKSILDFGTGTATLPVILCKNNDNIDVTGIDCSEMMLKKAKEKIEKENLQKRIKLVLDDKISLDEKFDAISCMFTIYLLDRNKMIENFSKHLKKDGLLVLTDVCYTNVLGKFGKEFVRIAQAIKGFPHSNFCSVNELRKMLENNGFGNIKIEKNGTFFFMNVYLVSASKL